MESRLYIGNLSWDTTEDSLRDAVQKTGRTVSKVNIKTDPNSGRSRGFAFVDIEGEEDAQEVISSLNGTELDGRPLKVGDAREQQVRNGGYGRAPGGGGGGFGRGGGFGGRGGGRGEGGGGGGGSRRW